MDWLRCPLFQSAAAVEGYSWQVTSVCFPSAWLSPHGASGLLIYFHLTTNLSLIPTSNLICLVITLTLALTPTTERTFYWEEGGGGQTQLDMFDLSRCRFLTPWTNCAATPPPGNSPYLIQPERQQLLLNLWGLKGTGHRNLSESATGGNFELLNIKHYLSQCIVWGQLTQESCSYLKMQGSSPGLELTALFCPGHSNLFLSPAGLQHHLTSTEPFITRKVLMWSKDTSRSQ